MHDPVSRALQIIENDPGQAEPLLDFLYWASREGVKNTAEFDRVEELLYSRTERAAQEREAYRDERYSSNC